MGRVLNFVAFIGCLGVGSYNFDKGFIGWGVFLCGLGLGNVLIATRSNE